MQSIIKAVLPDASVFLNYCLCLCDAKNIYWCICVSRHHSQNAVSIPRCDCSYEEPSVHGLESRRQTTNSASVPAHTHAQVRYTHTHTLMHHVCFDARRWLSVCSLQSEAPGPMECGSQPQKRFRWALRRLPRIGSAQHQLPALQRETGSVLYPTQHCSLMLQSLLFDWCSVVSITCTN